MTLNPTTPRESCLSVKLQGLIGRRGGKCSWKIGGTTTAPTSEFKMVVKAVLIYCLLALVFICVSIFKIPLNVLSTGISKNKAG